MSDLPQEFDLKFLPDWVKETPGANRYADYESESGDRPRRDRDDRRPQGPRPKERRGPVNRPGNDGPRGSRHAGQRDRDGRPQQRREQQRPRQDTPRPAPAVNLPAVKVEFLPEPNAAAGIARQIKASGRAYAVFSTSKLFLERPERHRVRITSQDPAVPLFQINDGPVSFDRATVERGAFSAAREEYYAEEKIEGEAIKGTFSNVARCRSTGALLAPTNHHSYQHALRKLYEERFSRRMSFSEFQHHEIEVLTNEQAVADWKEQARTITTYTTTKEAEPVIFKTLAEAEQHFRKTYLPGLVKSGVTLECSGPASRAVSDRHLVNALRDAWEAESRFPQQIVNGLRPFLVEAGLHFFKHRKRMLFVSATKPLRHPAGQTFSDGITAILRQMESTPRLKRPELAAKILGTSDDSPEAVARKEQLAADLHYLTRAGHVIEFSDGSLELPLAPQEKPAPEKAQPSSEAKQTNAETAPSDKQPDEETADSFSPPSGSEAPDIPATESSQPETSASISPA